MDHRIAKAQAVAVSTTNAVAAAVSDQTRRARLVATVGCNFALNRVATLTDTYLPANWPEDFVVVPGDVINVIAPSGTGTLFITDKR